MTRLMLFVTAVLLLPCSLTVQASDKPAVLVTGASSGIGERTTELLSAEGFYVYAGARKQADLDRLDAMENVEAVRLDVTVPGDIEAAVAQVAKGGRGLFGVVNNAGVAILQPLIEVEEEQLDFLFNVNIYGPYRITRAFAPMLIESKGRVVNISSISGVLSGVLSGPYSMSKHALEAYNDSLAMEMSRVDVKVIAIEPGNYASRIGESALLRARADGTDPKGSMFEKEWASGMDRLASRDAMADPIAVAKAIQDALGSEQPKPRYMVVPNQREADITIRKLLRETVEMNHDQPFSYDRDELVKMLDDALENL